MLHPHEYAAVEPHKKVVKKRNIYGAQKKGNGKERGYYRITDSQYTRRQAATPQQNGVDHHREKEDIARNNRIKPYTHP
jgi:hypothetical protein